MTMFVSYPKFEKDELERLNPPVWGVQREERDGQLESTEGSSTFAIIRRRYR